MCCRDKCYSAEVDCTGHGFLLEKKRRKQLNKSETNEVKYNLQNEQGNNNDL